MFDTYPSLPTDQLGISKVIKELDYSDKSVLSVDISNKTEVNENNER